MALSEATAVLSPRLSDVCAMTVWQTVDVGHDSSLADSYVSQTSHSAGGADELAASRKSAKYTDLLQYHLFRPTAVETSGFHGIFHHYFLY